MLEGGRLAGPVISLTGTGAEGDFDVGNGGAWVAGIVRLDPGELTDVPLGAVPVAVAVSSSLPALISAWVTV